MSLYFHNFQCSSSDENCGILSCSQKAIPSRNQKETHIQNDFKKPMLNNNIRIP